MTLWITSNLEYDEALGFNSTDVDSDTDSNVSSLSTALSNIISAETLGATYYTAPTGFPQYAEVTNFVSSINPVTNYSLASDSSGDGFSTTVGVATDLYVGTVQVSLYATSDPNVVVGRIDGPSADVVLTRS